MDHTKLPIQRTFSFSNYDKIETTLDCGVRLRIEKTGGAIAREYFMNEHDDTEVNIPDGLVIHDVTNNVVVAPVTKNHPFFVLAWSDTYSITHNNIEVMYLSTQRLWSVGQQDTNKY